MRQKAKQLCYGLIYGMGSKALSGQLKSTEAEAKEFMDSFIQNYPKVKTFIKQTVEDCEAKGYVETLAKRRRYLPNIKDENSTIKSKFSKNDKKPSHNPKYFKVKRFAKP